MGRHHLRVPLALAAASIAAACSPDSSPPPPDRARDAVAAQPTPPAKAAPSEKAPVTSGEMQREALAAEGPPPLPAAGPGQRRCGWLMNPTPGNWWLFDGHGEWILGTQGNELIPGMEDMPDMSTAGWVETNGHYGYGCACMTISYDPATRRVTRVADARPKPLGQCRADRKLPKPE